MITCSEVDRWLDEDRPAAGREAALAHAAGCARCSRAVAADEALGSALRAPPPSRAPAGLAAEVMARVQALGPDAGPAAGRGPGWLAVVAPWAVGGAGLGGVLWAMRGPLTRAASALGGALPGPERASADLAALERAVEAWAQGLSAAPPAALTAGSLAFAAASSVLAWLLARASQAAFTRRAFR